MMYLVERLTKLITSSVANLPTEEAFSIAFHNKGTDAATIDDSIPLAAGDTWHFNYLPNCVISQPFKITFDGGSGLTQKIVAIYSKAKPKH